MCGGSFLPGNGGRIPLFIARSFDKTFLKVPIIEQVLAKARVSILPVNPLEPAYLLSSLRIQGPPFYIELAALYDLQSALISNPKSATALEFRGFTRFARR
jgi:hypothetical protein